MAKNNDAKVDWKHEFSMKHLINYIVLAAVIVLLIVLNSVGVLKRGDLTTLTRIGFSMILALSLNLVVGFLGELSLGHAGFMCVGAYIGCYVSNLLSGALGNGVLPLIISMLAGGLMAAVFGFIIGIPALRLKGDYLAITTLAFGEIVRNIFKNLSLFGGAKGLSTDLLPAKTLYIVSFVTLFIVLFLSQCLIRSKHGRAITAIRDNEIAARAMGLNVTFYKLFVFTISAFFVGLAGVLYGKCFGTIRQETFDYNYSIEILVMVVLGGLGSFNGSMIAAAIITYINVLLQDKLSGSLAPLKLIVYAAILIFMILYNNAPAFAKLKEAVSPKKIIARLKKKPENPAKRKEDEAEWKRIESKIKMDEVLRTDVKTGDTYLTSEDLPRGGK